MDKLETLRREVTIDIFYRDVDNQLKIKPVKISFISQKILRLYSQYISEINGFKLDYEELKKTYGDVGQAAIGSFTNEVDSDGKLRPKKEIFDDKVQKTKDLIQKQENLLARIRSFDDETFFHKRFELVKMILLRNGVTDSDLLSYDWWDENVDATTITSFITQACEKDDSLLDKKKEKAIS